MFVPHLVLHGGVVIAPGGVVLPVVGGGVETVQDLLAVRGEEVAAHGLVGSAGRRFDLRSLALVAEDAAAVSHRVGSRHIAVICPVVTELPLTDADRHVLVMEAVLVVAEVPLVAARTSELLVLVLEVPALPGEKNYNSYCHSGTD